MAAKMGVPICSIMFSVFWPSRLLSTRSAGVSVSDHLMSAPAQKALPAPRKTMTFASGLASSSSKAFRSSVIMVRSMAFSDLGRLSMSVATLFSAIVTSIVSYMCYSLYRHWSARKTRPFGPRIALYRS